MFGTSSIDDTWRVDVFSIYLGRSVIRGKRKKNNLLLVPLLLLVLVLVLVRSVCVKCEVDLLHRCMHTMGRDEFSVTVTKERYASVPRRSKLQLLGTRESSTVGSDQAASPSILTLLPKDFRWRFHRSDVGFVWGLDPSTSSRTPGS